MDREFAVKFRHINGIVYYTNVWAVDADELFVQVESSGAEILLWKARNATDPLDARQLLAEYE